MRKIGAARQCLALALFAFGALWQIPALAQAVVSGPVHSAPQGDPSGNSLLNPSSVELSASGYIEEEYFIEGRARRYSSEEMETASVLDEGHPYKTRFIVRRPQSAADFNGIVVIEWNNVTGGRDLDIDWWQSGEHLARNGYAFIAVSAQRVGVNHLRETRPDRYASLDVSHDGMVNNDALSYDIFTAIAKAVPRVQAAAPDVDILGGLRAHTLIATGHSQSASRLASYFNNVHPLDPVFSGAMIHGGGGRIRDDQPVKIFRIMAETDMASRAANPQPDSDNFRHWEVAGTSHVDIPFEIEYAKMRALEAGQSPEGVVPRSPVCDRPAYSHVPFRHVMNAAFEHLREWIASDQPPPYGKALQISRVSPPLQFARDERGNILGGIRLAAHAVPTATNTGMNTGDSFCRLYGSHEPFDEQTLRQLYPSRQVYLDAVRKVVRENIEAGYILEFDGRATIQAAESSSIGRW